MTAISLEFFPPKTDKQREQFERTVARLKPLQPEYGSVTFGAGGSTLTYTARTVQALMDAGLDAAPHISCMGGTREEIGSLLDDYRDMGCRRVVALRGDVPSGMAGPGDFLYATDLVTFIRERYGDQFTVEVGCYPETHPQADHAAMDLQHFTHKVKAGADGAITQYFFNADAYFRFVAEARESGVDIPIVPGIMPISNFAQLVRFSNICGAEVPRWIDTRMRSCADNSKRIQELGADIVADMCKRLLDAGAPGLHLYTLNRSVATLEVLDRLGLADDVEPEQARRA